MQFPAEFNLFLPLASAESDENSRPYNSRVWYKKEFRVSDLISRNLDVDLL